MRDELCFIIKVTDNSENIREITNVFGGVGLKVRSVISLNKNDVVTLAYIIILITSY